MVPKFRIRTLGIGEQKAHFRRSYPTFTTSEPRRQVLVCRGKIKPTALSETYLVRISYEIMKTPKVYIEDPVIKRRQPHERIPHTYDEDRPCAFRPRIDWRSDRSLAILVPWISMWLYFYEVWYVTGEWHGGGVGHPVGKANLNKNEPEPAVGSN